MTLWCSSSESTDLLHKWVQANPKTKHKSKTGREGRVGGKAAAEQEEGTTCTYMMSVYLAEYDVDYTADHH